MSVDFKQATIFGIGPEKGGSVFDSNQPRLIVAAACEPLVFLKEISNVDRVSDKFLVHGQITTSTVQSSPVPPRSVPLPEGV